eukprot:CAMPEP_0177328916 /NCGR_PEP_ID=MMETSP0368-20130122/19691_1 /TAXON_ID=447022 ORGANISM="Scrippsiella hangoei-like, Strain SHHI-4" /NCGR_SAMPLE_ID=MMETSP0368 /ASSEMBLY_ACC=CAM_ASM_000363 /LENGTH=64 /DNA_ID=CAMNT_0018789101 /DNA_START=25 /DNA_END=215 /DNA_ORIENTATION=+
MSKFKPESTHNSKSARPLHKRCPMYLQKTLGSGTSPQQSQRSTHDSEYAVNLLMPPKELPVSMT